MKPPNEKVLEMTFNRYFLQSFDLGSIIMLAPTSRQEFESGYDTKIRGFLSFNEILIQYKRPKYLYKDNIFEINLTQHQHSTLMRL